LATLLLAAGHLAEQSLNPYPREEDEEHSRKVDSRVTQSTSASWKQLIMAKSNPGRE